MTRAGYHRRQAQVFAALALASSNPDIKARYNTMALEQLARAAAVDDYTFDETARNISRDGGSDMDRD